MGWFDRWRRASGAADADLGRPEDPQIAYPTAAGPGPSTPRREWTRAEPLLPTAAGAPLVGAPLFAAPDVAAARPLIPLADPAATTVPAAPPPGPSGADRALSPRGPGSDPDPLTEAMDLLDAAAAGTPTRRLAGRERQPGPRPLLDRVSAEHLDVRPGARVGDARPSDAASDSGGEPQPAGPDGEPDGPPADDGFFDPIAAWLVAEGHRPPPAGPEPERAWRYTLAESRRRGLGTALGRPGEAVVATEPGSQGELGSAGELGSEVELGTAETSGPDTAGTADADAAGATDGPDHESLGAGDRTPAPPHRSGQGTPDPSDRRTDSALPAGTGGADPREGRPAQEEFGGALPSAPHRAQERWSPAPTTEPREAAAGLESRPTPAGPAPAGPAPAVREPMGATPGGQEPRGTGPAGAAPRDLRPHGPQPPDELPHGPARDAAPDAPGARPAPGTDVGAVGPAAPAQAVTRAPDPIPPHVTPPPGPAQDDRRADATSVEPAESAGTGRPMSLVRPLVPAGPGAVRSSPQGVDAPDPGLRRPGGPRAGTAAPTGRGRSESAGVGPDPAAPLQSPAAPPPADAALGPAPAASSPPRDASAPTDASTRPTAPSTYRARLDPDPLAPVAAVPATAVNSFARMTGIDLGFVPLNRGPEVTGAAQESGARAFTRGGTVHLPGDGEPAQNSETEALLAHELVHVAQQRALGAAATEAGELGEALEAQAAAIERAVRGDGVGVVGVVGADGGVVGDGLSEAMDVPSELMGVDPGALSWTPISGFLPLGDAPAALEPQRAPWVPATPPRSAPPTDHPAAESPSARHVNENPSPGAPGERDTEDAAGATDGGVVAAGLAELSRRVEELARKVGKPVAADADAKIDLDDLAASLCDRVSNRIRADLVVERERAGRLYEFR